VVPISAVNMKMVAAQRANDRRSNGGPERGTITLFNRSTGVVPYMWLLCDGTGGTPDLRSMFQTVYETVIE
jgi:hypothetical protein